MLIGEGWITSAADLAAVQLTSSEANQFLKSDGGEEIDILICYYFISSCHIKLHFHTTGDILWATLAKMLWPDVGRLVVDNDGNGHYQLYRELFVDLPRVWLTMESARVKSLPKWSRMQHLGKNGTIECGKCGCNCSNGSLCPGIPIESDYRWERREKLGYYECRVTCPQGEGYQMSGGMFVATNFFCQQCFDRMVELEVVKTEDYDRVAGTTLFDETTE